MRLITFKHQNKEKLGAWINNDQQIVDLLLAASFSKIENPMIFESMQNLIDAGPTGLTIAQELVISPMEFCLVSTQEVLILAPLVPVQLRDFLCFEQHLINSFNAAKKIEISKSDDPEATKKALDKSDVFSIPQVWYDSPVYYNCSRLACCGTETIIEWPSYSKIWDYELEWAAIIGKKGKNISKEMANNYIFGYTIFNDLSARDEQLRVIGAKLGPGKGKDFNNSNILGPCIVTADEFDNPYDLNMIAKVNDEIWSQGNTKTMYHKFEDIIAYISQDENIYPGEVLGSGTVGSGCGLEQLRFLISGDIIELSIDKIGMIINTVV